MEKYIASKELEIQQNMDRVYQKETHCQQKEMEL